MRFKRTLKQNCPRIPDIINVNKRWKVIIILPSLLFLPQKHACHYFENYKLFKVKIIITFFAVILIFNLNAKKQLPIERNNEIIEDEGYLTDIIADEACSFIKMNANGLKPFFLYVPFNAVHWPLQAPESDIVQFNTGNKNRDIMLAMIHRMDIAINSIVEMLKSTGQYENTIVFYFSDNGGARKNHADNKPLRDYKQSTYEGGIRVPFIISWPGKFKPGIWNEPIISLDILPTIMDILEKNLPKDRMFDGKSILSVINSELKEPLHEQLFFDGNEGKWAVREGNYKLVKNGNNELELYDLETDISESNNIISSHKEVANHLEKCYYKWRSKMGKPMSENQFYK